MRYLITGGSGFIGSHLIKTLSTDSSCERILNLDLRLPAWKYDNVETALLNINVESELNKIVSRHFDICIHLAALCKEPGYEWEEYFQTNHVGTINVIKLCEQLEIKKIIFTSTMMVFKAGENQMDENSLTAPDTAYGISKLLAEKELDIWCSKSPSRKLKIIRPAVVFGQNENGNFTRLYKTLKKGFFPYVGKSSTIKSNVYVTELVYFIHYLLESDSAHEIYNFAFPEKYSMKRIVNEFKEVFGLRPISPTLPFTFLQFIAFLFEFLNSIGLKNSIHHRRIEKLYHSTDIYPKNAEETDYQFQFNLKSALEDWKNACTPDDIY